MDSYHIYVTDSHWRQAIKGLNRHKKANLNKMGTPWRFSEHRI